MRNKSTLTNNILQYYKTSATLKTLKYIWLLRMKQIKENKIQTSF